MGGKETKPVPTFPNDSEWQQAYGKSLNALAEAKATSQIWVGLMLGALVFALIVWIFHVAFNVRCTACPSACGDDDTFVWHDAAKTGVEQTCNPIVCEEAVAATLSMPAPKRGPPTVPQDDADD